MQLVGLGAAAGAVSPPVRAERSQKPPNILWITCEDISAHLGCYGFDYAATPILDRLAAEGVRYSHAFAHAPVCAPARSGLLSGMYPAALGSHNMRSKATLPSNVRGYSAYLRDAGYFCTNNSKEDYNYAKPDGTWDISSRSAHWRKRKEGQPFFSIFNFTLTHESKIRQPDRSFFRATERLSDAQRHDPEKVPVPPYHPNTPESRQDWSRYHDLIAALDYEVGDLLAELEKDGLAEDTIVVFYSDHGAGMPRSKRWPYDSGIHVPLIVRFPEKYASLAPGPAGSVLDRLVSFVDFGPTALSLAGVPVPEHMQGRPFLGLQDSPPRDCVFAARDRMDERYDCVRVVRTKRHKYIRNFMAHLPYNQYLDYMYQMPTMKVWQELADAGKLEGAPTHFVGARKPVEELYDLEKDPHEINNLADAPEHAGLLTDMRGRLHNWILETRDLAFLPESEMHIRAAGRPERTLGLDENAYPLSPILETAELPVRGAEAIPELQKRLAHEDSAVRFWAAIGLAILEAEGGDTIPLLEKALSDPAPSVRLAAAEALCRKGRHVEALKAAAACLEHENEWARLRALNLLDRISDGEFPGEEAYKQQLGAPNKYLDRVARHALGIGPKQAR